MASTGIEPRVERSVDTPAPTSSQDQLLYRVLVAGLVAAVIVTLVGAIVLAFVDRVLPGEAIALGAVCAGGLVGLLAPSPVK